jgi:sarcosine oxidase subunit gamma
VSDSITVSARELLTLVSILPRRDRSVALVQAIRQHFGIEPAPRRFVSDGRTGFVWFGADQLFALREEVDPNFADRLTERLAGVAAVTDVSDSRSVLRIAGPGAIGALARSVPIDLHPRAFGPGAAARTIAAHIPLEIWQVDGVPSFDLACPRSYAESFRHSLHVAPAPAA